MKYADRDPQALEPHYSAHVEAMTVEGLHSKSAIAAELAFRDAEIVRLRKSIAPMPVCDCGANAACAGLNGPPPHKPECAAMKPGIPGGAGTFTLGGEKDPRP